MADQKDEMKVIDPGVAAPDAPVKSIDSDEPIRTISATKGQVRDAYWNGAKSYAQLAEEFDLRVEDVRRIIEGE